jgi:hypothetical protein
VAGYGLGVSEVAGREFGEVLVAFADDPPNGPRLLIGAAAEQVLFAVALLALVDAGESPWASLRGAGQSGEGDPFGYSGALLRLEIGERSVAYRIGEWVPGRRGYAARLGVDLEVVGEISNETAQFLVGRDCRPRRLDRDMDAW